MRRTTIALLIATLFFSVGVSLKKLEQYEQDHYAALRVWMTPDQDKAFFKLKTREERDAYLKDQELWDKFYKYPEDIRAKILVGDVVTGWTQDMVYMSWGNPYKKKRLTGRPSARSELFIYRFEVTPDGSVMPWVPGSKATYKAVSKFQLDLYVDDMTVSEIKQKDKWE